MATKIFVNLPVKNLKKSIEFFTRLGFTFNPRFTDETATCMIVAEDIFVMLLTEEKFKTFTPKKICDATQSTEVLVCPPLRAGQRSTRWFARQSLPAGQPTTNHKTMVSCMGTDFRTWTVTFGNSSSWNPAPRAKAKSGTTSCRAPIQRRDFMQYMLMCCFDEKAWTNFPDEDKEIIMREYGELMQSLAKSGHLRGSGKLRSSSSATTVRMKNGKPIFTDGPFAETREQLGGYHLVECQDLDEALSIATRIPTLPAGGVIEVRSLEPFPESDLGQHRIVTSKTQPVI